MRRDLTKVEVEGAGSMKHHVQARSLDHLIKGISLGNVRHDGDFQLVRLVLERLANLVCLVFGADGCDDFIALVEKLLKDMGCF